MIDTYSALRHISRRVDTERVSIAFPFEKKLLLDNHLIIVDSGLEEKKLRDEGTCSTKGRHLRSLIINRY